MHRQPRWDLRIGNDDLLLLRPAGTVWEAWATPFGRRRAPEVRSAPLRALLCLVQSQADRLEPMSRGAALGELVANSPVVNADPVRSPALLGRWEEILRTAPVSLLHFQEYGHSLPLKKVRKTMQSF